MRLGVLDIGSNTIHLLVVDAHQGARPLPAYSHKKELRLAEHLEDLDGDGGRGGRDGGGAGGGTGARLSDRGARLLQAAVEEALGVAEDKGVEDLLAFATSAVRDAVNGEEVLEGIRTATDTPIRILSGEDESRLTFLAVRRWFGWSSGRLLVLDIGGGSLEIASGVDEEPDVAASLPLGAGRLTRDRLGSDPPSPEEVRALRKHIRAEIARQVGPFLRAGKPDHAVATSKTFKQLARVAGAAPSSEGPYVKRVLRSSDAAEWAEKLAKMSSAERAALPGVSVGRAPQMLAGALVADATMDLFGLKELEICPWALREGVILRRLDVLPAPPPAWSGGPVQAEELNGRS